MHARLHTIESFRVFLQFGWSPPPDVPAQHQCGKEKPGVKKGWEASGSNKDQGQHTSGNWQYVMSDQGFHRKTYRYDFIPVKPMGAWIHLELQQKLCLQKRGPVFVFGMTWNLAGDITGPQICKVCWCSLEFGCFLLDNLGGLWWLCMKIMVNGVNACKCASFRNQRIPRLLFKTHPPWESFHAVQDTSQSCSTDLLVDSVGHFQWWR